MLVHNPGQKLRGTVLVQSDPGPHEGADDVLVDCSRLDEAVHEHKGALPSVRAADAEPADDDVVAVLHFLFQLAQEKA